MTSMPVGTVTLLFTDIEGSTRLWEEHQDGMRAALARHDELLRSAIETSGGVVFKTIGDAFCAAFPSTGSAVAAGLLSQQSLQEEPWSLPVSLRVRMALHSGNPDFRDRDYFGPPVNRVARLLTLAHGGQTILSESCSHLVRDQLPAGCTLRALGRHRLKDLSQPEEVYQLCHASLPDSFPVLRSIGSYPNNLPVQLTSFIGREAEAEQLRELLRDHRMVTLTGVGGCGKTRLCLQTAVDLLDRYGDGVWFVELAPVSDGGWIPQAVALGLGLKEEAGVPLVQTIVNYLCSRSALLILDNCEHVLAGAALFCDSVLKQCAKVSILASSREGLGVVGEQTMRIPSLGEFESVELFVDRARLQQPMFALTGATERAVQSVCSRLDGIPLAIELAAARVRAMSVEQIGDRLDQRFRLLTGGSRHVLPRQQTLRALIDWSYDLLNEEEQLLLQRLSVFVGGFTLEASEGVCRGGVIDEYAVLDLLTSLVDKSLVIYDEGRYRLLETVRQYGLEKLTSAGASTELRCQHRDWYARLLAAAQEEMIGTEKSAWYSRLEVEHGNLRDAIEWCTAEAKRGDVASLNQGLNMVAHLHGFWVMRGHWQTGRDLVEGLLGVRNGSEDPDASAHGKRQIVTT